MADDFSHNRLDQMSDLRHPLTVLQHPKAFNGGWFPAVLPVASLEGERFGLNVALVPPLKDRLYGAVSFQLKVRLGE
jgi:hypothetical protein